MPGIIVRIIAFGKEQNKQRINYFSTKHTPLAFPIDASFRLIFLLGKKIKNSGHLIIVCFCISSFQDSWYTSRYL